MFNPLENLEELCYVHESLQKNEDKGTILLLNYRVCLSSNEHPFEELDGNKYCLFHLPSTNKDGEKLFQKFLKKLRFIDDKLAEAENIGERQRNRFLRHYIYDFSYVWFNQDSFNPMILDANEKQGLDFYQYKFRNDVLFNFAVFETTSSRGFREMEFYGRADFSNAKFSLGEYFDKTIFHEDAIFRNTELSILNSFKGAEFHGNVDFTGTDFGTTDFSESLFLKNVKFDETTFPKFRDVSFNACIFGSESDIGFLKSKFFSKVSFENCKAKGIVRFNNLELNEKSEVDFKNAAFEDTKHITFVSCQLRPSNFINVGVQKFSLADIDWGKDFGSKAYTLSELENIKALPNSRILFVITCRQFAENAEKNDRFEEASNFRRMAFETEWLEISDKSNKWFNEILNAKKNIELNFGHKKVDLLAPLKKTFYIIRHFEFPHLFYRYLSGYGESWRRATIVLALAVFLIFPLIYTCTNFQITPETIPLEVVVKDCKDVDEKLKSVCKIDNRGLYFWSEAIPHSLATASLQTLEYRIPKTPFGKVLVILEMIFAPLQTALLALAIRRKFMR